MSGFQEPNMITTGAEFNASSECNYGKVRVHSNGGKSVSIVSTTSKKVLHLSSPLMMTWGLNVNEFEAGKKTYDMSLQFPKEEYDTPTIQKFLENMKAFEAKLKLDACFIDSSEGETP